MQIQKENIKNKILKEAKKEFQKKGFSGANIREMAKRAGVSIGNIYNYFPNKDAIFQELVKPAIEGISGAFRSYEEMDFLEDEYKWGLEYHVEFIKEVSVFLDFHRENLELIFFKSQGSKLENYNEEFIEKYTELMIDNMKVMKKEFPDAVSNVSDFFVHTIASLHANVISEIIMHDLSFDEMLYNLNELMVFLFNGWDSIIDREKIFPDFE